MCARNIPPAKTKFSGSGNRHRRFAEKGHQHHSAQLLARTVRAGVATIGQCFVFLFCGAIKGYQLLSPLLGPRCRFYPSCSHYAIEALQMHGFRYGFFLTIKRLLKCHPGFPGGFDNVPLPKQSQNYGEKGNNKRDV